MYVAQGGCAASLRSCSWLIAGPRQTPGLASPSDHRGLVIYPIDAITFPMSEWLVKHFLSVAHLWDQKRITGTMCTFSFIRGNTVHLLNLAVFPSYLIYKLHLTCAYSPSEWGTRCNINKGLCLPRPIWQHLVEMKSRTISSEKIWNRSWEAVN